ncbi:hypothetical protein [Streptomyces sp. NPDC004250]|uniref:hypothetical protein n=1 Tax=Streptomyces sp. NPDC004250 TaxID=3364692 RepID=UPI003675FA80
MVDEDVDLFDTEDVLWAMTTRFQADKDLVVLPGVAGHVLDPPSPRNTTRPCPPRASLPGWSTTPPGPTVCGPSAETSINGPGTPTTRNDHRLAGPPSRSAELSTVMTCISSWCAARVMRYPAVAPQRRLVCPCPDQ